MRAFFNNNNERSDYEVHVEDGKVIVFSECCCDTMSDETARALYVELHKLYGEAK